MRDVEDGFFEEELRTAGDGGAGGGVAAKIFFVYFHLAEKLRRESAALVGAGGEVAAIEDGKAVRVGTK